MYTLEEKRVGRFTVKLHPDDTFNAWEDVLCDEPVMVFTRDRFRTSVLHDGTKDVTESIADVLRLADDSYSWTDVLDEMDADWTYTETGTLRVDSSSLKSVRYFKDAESAVRSIFRADYGKELKDFRLERFSTRYAEFYLAWYQPELDHYAGTKDARAPIETVRAYLDGEIYGWTVEDADGDVFDSCWGYIGDASYPLSEAEDVARGLEDAALVEDAKTLEASRPDLYADA
jgi:hypothetical protein